MTEQTSVLSCFTSFDGRRCRAWCAFIILGAQVGCAGSDARDLPEEGAAAQEASAGQCTPATWDNPGKVSIPSVEPVPAGLGRGKPFDQGEGLDEFGYEMTEYFVTGTAPEYKTRMVVRKPKDPAKFSGTVFTEWYNVSGGFDVAVLWASSREYMMREGHAFASISVQAGGVNALKGFDKTRYASLKHPGDAAAPAIHSQIGAALRSRSESVLGPCMPVRAMLATGQSQSSFRLAQYVNTTQATDRVYDGFLLLAGREPASSSPPVPVFTVLTMNEGNGSLADGPNYVKWSVAGATHVDNRIISRNLQIDLAGTGLPTDLKIDCTSPINDFPSYRAYNAALDGLHRWVREGKRPSPGKPFTRTGSSITLDESGNPVGGLRIPDMDVPVAAYGTGNTPKNVLDVLGLFVCAMAGKQVAFTRERLKALYPTHEDYVRKYTAAADQALAAGHLLKADYDDAVAAARIARVPE